MKCGEAAVSGDNRPLVIGGQSKCFRGSVTMVDDFPYPTPDLIRLPTTRYSIVGIERTATHACTTLYSFWLALQLSRALPNTAQVLRRTSATFPPLTEHSIHIIRRLRSTHDTHGYTVSAIYWFYLTCRSSAARKLVQVAQPAVATRITVRRS